MGTKRLSTEEFYKLWDEYSKLDSKDKVEYLEGHELSYHDSNDYSACYRNFEANHEESSVFDLTPEGMADEYFSDDDYLGDVR